MSPSMRRFAALLASVALLLAAFPGAVSAASDASITGGFAPLGTCKIDSDGLNGFDPCLPSDELLLLQLKLSNTGDATLTHVKLSAPLTATGATGPARVVAAGMNGALEGVPCDTTEGILSCSAAELPSRSTIDVVLGFDPADTPGVYLETVEYAGTVSVTAKASTRSGSKTNFQRSSEIEDSATFLLSAQDADSTESYRVVDDGQETTLTLPNKPAGIYVFVDQLVVETRGDPDDFCGDPGLSLGTCFGLAVHVEVEDADGNEYVFRECDLRSESRATTCLSIEIMWDPQDPTIAMPLLYQGLPSLITAYDHGNSVEKCAVIDLASEDGTAGGKDRACSTDATTIQSGDRVGWIVMTIYTASNGNWGAG